MLPLVAAAPGQVAGLEALLAEARAASPAARRARLQRDAAVAAADRTRPRLRPDVTLRAVGDANAPQVRDPAAPGAVVRRALAGRVELQLEQLLFHAGRDPLERRADAAEAAAEADLAAALDQLDHQVRLAYLALFQARAGLAIADEGVKRAESQRGRVEDLLQVEKVAEVDRLHAQAGQLQAQAAQVEAANGVELATANLNRLLGRADLGTTLDIAPPGDGPGPPELGPAVAWAEQHRPEVLALLARIAESDAGAAFARAERAPTLAVTSTLATQTPAAFEPSAEARVGLELRWPISRADDAPGRRQAEAENGLAQARLGLEELRAGIALEVRRSLLDHQAAVERLRLADARLAAAAEAHRIRLLQYERQRCTLLEVREALMERSRAELDRVVARVDIHRALADCELATGRDLAAWSAAAQPEGEPSHAPAQD